MNVRYFEKRPGAWHLDFKGPGGKRLRPYGGPTEAEARASAAEVIARALGASAVPSVPATATAAGKQAVPLSGVTLQDAYDTAMKTREGWIMSKDKATLKHTFESLGVDPTTDCSVLTRDYVRDLRARWLTEPGKRQGTKLSASTINHRLSMLAVLLDTADLPPHGVKHLSTKGTRRTRRIPQREINAMQSWCFANARLTGALALADLITVALETCGRQGELLGIQAGDIQEDTVVFRDTKNGETRTVPLPAASRRILEARKALPGGPFAELTESQLGNLWSQMRQALGLEADAEFVFHTLRHEGISRLADAGVNAFVIQAIAGHSNITTTQIYAKASAQAMREAQAAVAQRALLDGAQAGTVQ